MGRNGSGDGDYPIGLPEPIFRRLMQGIGDHQEGLALKRIREYLQISLREAASYAAITPGYLWRIEHGDRHAHQWTLITLCFVALSLSPAETIFILRIAGKSPA